MAEPSVEVQPVATPEPGTARPAWFGELVGMRFVGVEPRKSSSCELDVGAELLNPLGVLHGAVLYALADTGMGYAVLPALESGVLCAAAQISIVYHAPVSSGTVRCDTRVLRWGSRLVSLASEIHCGARVVASALGSYAIIPPRNGAARPRNEEE